VENPQVVDGCGDFVDVEVLDEDESLDFEESPDEDVDAAGVESVFVVVDVDGSDDESLPRLSLR